MRVGYLVGFLKEIHRMLYYMVPGKEGLLLRMVAGMVESLPKIKA